MNKKNIFLIFVILLIAIIYFSFPLIIMPDSSEYYSYLDFFYGVSPLSSWDVVRGPTLPFLIFLSTIIFGNNMLSILGLTYASFILFNYFFYKSIIEIIKKTNPTKFILFFIWSIYFIFILFNPILFGYFHSLLTEFVAISLALISCIISWKWLNVSFFINKKKYIIYNLAFMFLFVFSWFLKQPYFSTVLFPLLISCIISVLKQRNIKNIIQRGVTFISCLLFLFFSMFIWKSLLEKNGVDYKNGKNNEYFLSKAIINGMGNFRIEKDMKAYANINKDILISKADFAKIRNKNCNNYKIINILNSESTISKKTVVCIKGKEISSKEALIFLATSFIKYPEEVVNSYISGYLATINIYVSSREENGVAYFPIKIYNGFNHENSSIGLAYLKIDNNFLWIQDYHYEKVSNLYSVNSASPFLKKTLNSFSKINLSFFKIAYLFLPILLIYSLYKRIHLRKNTSIQKKNIYEFTIILFGFSMLNILFHVFTGAIIDRYVFIGIPEIVLGGIILLLARGGSVVSMKAMIEIKKNKNKLLFVIPAYNEALNIGKVLDEIRKDFAKADIIVINDCSKDNTEIVLKDKKIDYINMPFNVGYSKAVQTGIKYAYQNNYDYVIQFDADGQHIAKEAKKLYETAVKGNCDIVMGSRFLDPTGYKHSFFRKIGTKIFSLIIKLICKEKITDPTSGFQCLNRRVIEQYSIMGKYPEFPDANLIIEMLFNGYKVQEIPVKMRLRESGVSMHGGIIKPIKYMIKVLYAIMIILIRNIKSGGIKK